MDLVQSQILAPLIAIIIVKIVYVLRNYSKNKRFKLKNLIDNKTDISFLISLVAALTFANFFKAGDFSAPVLNSVILLYLAWKVSKKAKLSHWYAVAIGFGSALLASLNHLEANWQWLNTQPGTDESRIYLYIGLGLFVAAEAIIFKFKGKDWRKLPTAKKIIRFINGTVVFPAMLLIAFSLIQLETTNEVFSDRVYIYFAFLYLVAANIWAYFSAYSKSKKHLKEERKHFMKLKKKDKKRKKKSKKTKKSRKK